MADGQTRDEAERNAAPILAEYHEQFIRGDPLGLVGAVRLCVRWGLPIPEWAAEHAEAAIIFYFEKGGGAPKRGRTGSLITQWRRYRKHLLQAQLAEHEIAKGGTKAAALERARHRLPRSARVEAKEIERWRKRVAKLLRRDERGP